MSIFSEEFNPQDEFVLNEDYFNISLGVYALKGSSAYRTETGCTDNKFYEFKAFEVYKVYLEITRNTQQKAEKLLDNITPKHVKKGFFNMKDNKMQPRNVNNRTFLLEEKNKNDLWKFFSYQILSLIFACTTLEAFANKIIWQKNIQLEDVSKINALTKPYENRDRFTIEKIKRLINDQSKSLNEKDLIQNIKELLLNDNSPQIISIKEDFLRQLNLDEKLFEVILKIYNIENQIKDLKTIREQIKRIIKLRNVFIHLKDRDLRTGDKPSNKGQKIWGELIPKFNKSHNELRFKPYNIVEDLIKQIQTAINRPSFT